jgi:TatD DNase family protein
MNTFVDSHAHLDGPAFDEDRELVLERARAAGIAFIVNIGATDGLAGAQRSIELAQRYDWIWCSVGIHPHDSGANLDFQKIRRLAAHPKVCAIGETGLDFFRDWAPVAEQERYFDLQIELACEVQKPIIIHSREAGPQCLARLTGSGIEQVGGVFHCYSESVAFAETLASMNFYVSFPGSLTFPKASALREVAAAIPLEQILLETDSPYLAPVPFRGKRCESAFMIETAKMLAEVKQLSLETVAQQTTNNVRKLFSI